MEGLALAPWLCLCPHRWLCTGQGFSLRSISQTSRSHCWPSSSYTEQGHGFCRLSPDFTLIMTVQVRAGESLMKLVSDLKQFLILNDFPSVNEAIDQRNQQLRALQEECDRKLITLRDEVSIDLYELEEEYYSSRYK